MQKSIEVLLERLICPNCKSNEKEVSLETNFESNEINCLQCHKVFPFENRQVDFLRQNAISISDPLDKIKSLLKKSARLYNILVQVISSVSSSGLKRIQKEISSFGSGKFILNVGSGSSELRSDIINLDIFAYSNVDLICFADAIPIASNSVDMVLSIAMLEHVDNPVGVVSEINRILLPGGELLGVIPFMQGVHASPYDFQRYTVEGLKVLFKDFEVIEIRGYGPTSALLWISQDWIAHALSFGQRKIQMLVWLILQPTTFFLKYLDVVFDRMSLGSPIPSYYFFKVRKH